MSSATFVAAPAALGLTGPAASLSRQLGAAYGGMSLGTAYPLGVVKLIPFPAHLTMDAVTAPALAAAPWLFGFANDTRARNFFIGMAAVTAVVTALTQWRRAD